METSTQKDGPGASSGTAKAEPATATPDRAHARGEGIEIERRFTLADDGSRIDPIQSEEWERRTAVISGEGGDVVFEQKDVEIPSTWSQLATNVVASKYFRGQLGTPARETSVKQLIGRVVGSVRTWGLDQGYFKTPAQADVFADELSHLLVKQKAQSTELQAVVARLDEQQAPAHSPPHR